MATKNKNLKLTLVRSLIGRRKQQIATVSCLGLRRMHHSVIVPDNPVMRGMINKVNFLLQVEESN